MEILNNSWFIGIGTGILSGIIVTLITRKIFTKKDEREVAQNILSANREILYALRPGISEGHVPERDVLDSLRNATARRYKLEPHLLYSPKSIAEELIKEIMDSSFISSDTKRQYCESLNSLLSPENPEHERAEQLENTRFVARIEYRERMTMLFSLTIGLLAAMATVYITIKSSSSGSVFSKVFDSLMPTMLVLGATVLLMNVFIAAMKIRHRRLREEFGVPIPESSNNQRQPDA